MSELPLGSRKICVVGAAPTSAGLAPYADESWEIWSLTALGMLGIVPRWNVWFELHDLSMFKPPACPQNYNGYLEWMAKQTKPIYLQEPTPDIPSGVKYPLQDVLDAFPRRYFNNSISWMLALAIMERPAELAVYGVDMATSDEYHTRQKEGVHYYLGYAEGKGIKVTVPRESDMFSCSWLYCFDVNGNRFVSKLETKEAELEQRIAEADNKIKELASMRDFFKGASEQIKYLKQNWI